MKTRINFASSIRFTCLVLLLFGASSASTGISSPLPVKTEVPLQTMVLQLKWTHQWQFAGYYAALEEGFYRQAGLDVQIVEGSPDLDAAQQVIQGKADFGIASSGLVLLKARGFPVVSLAAIYQHSPMVILGNPRNGVTNIHTLAGKSLRLEAQSAEILAYLKNENVPLEQVTILPYALTPQGFADGSIDASSAYLTDEPFELQQQHVDYYLMNPRASGVDFYGDCLFTTQSVIQKDPALVKAFVEASLRGWQYALDHPTEMVTLISTRYHSTHTPEHLAFEAEQSRDLIMANVVELGYQNPGRWQRISEIYAELGLIGDPVDLASFIYNPNPPADLRGLYLALTSILAVLMIISLITTRFYYLNRALKNEVKRREATETHLKEMEFRYRTLVENSPFPIIISSLSEGVLVYVNQRAADLFGVERGFSIGRKVVDFYETPADRQYLLDGLERSGSLQNWEVRLKMSSGQRFWASLSATYITFDGQPCAFVALLDISQQKEIERILTAMTRTDTLTGISTRGYFIEMGKKEIERAQRYHLPLSLLMIDIDFFKRVNDTCGHAVGDQVLVQFSAMLREQVRVTDIPGRLGGEEFGVLLPNTDLTAALILAERLREAAQTLIILSGTGEITITISIGVAQFCSPVCCLDELLKFADQALYHAKHAGRNRVEMYVKS